MIKMPLVRFSKNSRCITYASASLALCLCGAQADAEPNDINSLWASTSTYICTIERPNGEMTLLALQASGKKQQIDFRILGLNGWPEKQILASATPYVAPIPPFNGGMLAVANFETVFEDGSYRIGFVVHHIPLLKSHKIIEKEGHILINRFTVISISKLQQNGSSKYQDGGQGFCEAQDDDEIFRIAE